MAVTATDPFERLYRRYARDVYGFALSVVRNPAEAEDVTQTTFLNAYRALKRGDRPERPQSWLIAIAHNAIRSRHRWTLRRPKEVPLEAAAYQLAAPVEERSGIRDVLAALGELPVNQRAALTMRELEGRSYPEIAETLGVSVPAVESLISRARRTLRSRRAALRGLILLQLPRSLRGLVEQGDGLSGSLLPKAAALVVGAGLVTAGIGVGRHHTRAPEAGSARHVPQLLLATGVPLHAPRARHVARKPVVASHATTPAPGRSAPAARRAAPSAPATAPSPAPALPAAGPSASPPPTPPMTTVAELPTAPVTTVAGAAVDVVNDVADAVTDTVTTQLPTVPAPLPQPPPLPSVPQVSDVTGIK